MTVLVTGSRGLVGTALLKLLKAQFELKGMDLRNGTHEDVRLSIPLTGIEGIVHLAAVSRVIHAEQDPALCVETNVKALKSILANALDQRTRPWMIFVSSREVYGDATSLPANEDTSFSPKNVYARSKVEGENLCQAARDSGLTINIARLSSVYGSTDDHADRVAPCFARAAAFGENITIEGDDHIFDFTHVADVAKGLQLLTTATSKKELFPPIHFVSGHGTLLEELAQMSAQLAPTVIEIKTSGPRPYGVNRFFGDPARARALLGWNAQIELSAGFTELVNEFRKATLPQRALLS